MRFSHTLYALIFSGLATAQLPDIPSCSLNCFVSALSDDGCSQLTDFACHCKKPQLVDQVTPCVQKACDAAQQSSVSNVVVEQCSKAGHPISVPPVSGAAPTNVEHSQAITSPASSSVRQTCYPISDGSSDGGGNHPTSTPLIPSSSSAIPSSSGPASSSASTSPPVFTGAAANVKGNVAGVAVVVAAAIYAV